MSEQPYYIGVDGEAIENPDHPAILLEALEAIAEGDWGTLLRRDYASSYMGSTEIQSIPPNSEIRVLARLVLKRWEQG